VGGDFECLFNRARTEVGIGDRLDIRLIGTARRAVVNLIGTSMRSNQYSFRLWAGERLGESFRLTFDSPGHHPRQDKTLRYQVNQDDRQDRQDDICRNQAPVGLELAKEIVDGQGHGPVGAAV
jgi:hypothetical protein